MKTTQKFREPKNEENTKIGDNPKIMTTPKIKTTPKMKMTPKLRGGGGTVGQNHGAQYQN